MKTPSITKFDYLYWASIILDIFVLIAGWDFFVLILHEQVHAAGGGPDLQLFTSELAPFIIGGALAFSVFIWMLISLGRIGFFRWVLAGLILFDLSGLALTFAGEPTGTFADPYMEYFLYADAFSSLLMAVSAFFLFRADATAWFRREV